MLSRPRIIPKLSPRQRFLSWVLLGLLPVGFLLYTARAVEAQVRLAPFLAVGNLLVLVLCFRRAGRRPEEASGWQRIGWAQVLVLFANGALALADPLDARSGWPDLAFLLLSLSVALIQGWAFLAWPWRRNRGWVRSLDILGSLIFASSFFLLLHLLGVWQAGLEGMAVKGYRMVAIALRFTLAGGVLAYLVGEDPRRLRGPLGYLLAAQCLIGPMLVILFQLGAQVRLEGWVTATLGTLALCYPILVCEAILSPHGVEVPPESKPLPLVLSEAIPYLPFLGAGAMLGVMVSRDRHPLAGALVAFLGIALLMGLRQFLLMRELKASHALLEQRVLQRTRALEEMQERVLRTERLNTMATLGAGIAHDLGNLLQVLRAGLDFLGEGAAGADPRLHPQLSRMDTALERASKLNRRLLEFGRKDREQESALHDLGAALIGMEPLLRILLPRNIALEVRIEPNLGRVEVDGTALEQVVMNLVGNARDALGGGGWVCVRAFRDLSGQWACLEVEDSGPGVPESVKDHLFEAFVTTKPAGKGTGLGLASVRALAESMGGSAELISVPSRGAIFRISIPILASAGVL